MLSFSFVCPGSTTSTPKSHSSLFISNPTSVAATFSPFRSIPSSRSFSLAASKMAYIAASTDGSESSSFTEERIVLTNGHNEKLIGILQKTNSDDLVVLCHGFRSTKESKPISYLSDALLSQGISTFRFDFSGNGESDGTFMYGNYWKEVEDLRTAVMYFSEKRNIPVRGIVGHSKGGDVVILYASKYHDIPTVVNISGRFDLKIGVKERLGDDFLVKIKNNGFIDVATNGNGIGYRVTEQSLMDRFATDVKAACSTIDPTCKVLTIHGSSDIVIPVSDASEFHRLISNHELRIVEGADHSYTQNKTELTSAVVHFLKSNF